MSWLEFLIDGYKKADGEVPTNFPSKSEQMSKCVFILVKFD
jgi:hypothetical protein